MPPRVEPLLLRLEAASEDAELRLSCVCALELLDLELGSRDPGLKLVGSLLPSTLTDVFCSRSRMYELIAAPSVAWVFMRWLYGACLRLSSSEEPDIQSPLELLDDETDMGSRTDDADDEPSAACSAIFSASPSFLMKSGGVSLDCCCVWAMLSTSILVGKSCEFRDFCLGLPMSIGMACRACSRMRSWTLGSSEAMSFGS
mmetsp:Transcript_18968/g.71793  ORF Transcript_18968/g.71793 Transcript_18968/m.71793 type:complete len:201 (+) Transcript_18968:613-1215(+)